MVRIISFPSLAEGENGTISSHISQSGNNPQAALDGEMGRKSHEISGIVVKV